jgi:hypothetical protein
MVLVPSEDKLPSKKCSLASRKIITRKENCFFITPASLSPHTKQQFVVLIYVIHFNYSLHHAANTSDEYLMTSRHLFKLNVHF